MHSLESVLGHRLATQGLGLAVCLSAWSTSAADVGSSPFYEYEIVAEIGSSKTGGAVLTKELNAAQPGDSPITFNHAINDAGDVLFEATFFSQDADPNKKVVDTHRVIGRPGLLVLDQIGKGSSFYQGAGGLALDGTVYTGNDIFTAGNLINPAGSICEVVLDELGFAKPCNGVLPLSGTVSRNGRIAIVGLDTVRIAERNAPWLGVYDVLSFGGGGSALQLRAPLADAGKNESLFLAGWANAAVADTGRLVIGEFDGNNRRIAVIEPDGRVTELERSPAPAGAIDYVTNPTLSLLPGISADGEFVAYARREKDGLSDSIVLVQPTKNTPFAEPTVVFSSTNVIALQSDFTPVRFSRIGMQPVSIIRHDAGADGQIEGDTLWLLFAGQPDAASRDNPHRPGVPLVIRNSIGIWALRVDIRRELPSGDRIVFHPSGPIPVLQVGDTVRGQPIRLIDLSRSLGRGTADRLGNLRKPTSSDHVAAIRVETDDGPAIIRATHFDTDEDGLPDHWERPDGGIDADRDGAADLRLAEFGADPLRKDLFIEMDWLAPRTTGHPTGWRTEPLDRALDLLVEMFATAPVTNATGEIGITLHIDAGPGRDRNGRSFSRNFPTGQQGGDQVMLDGIRPDIVQLGSPEKRTLGPFQIAPLDSIKDRYFGTADNNAREYAFRYVLLGDFLGYQSSLPDVAGGATPFQVTGTLGQRIALRLSTPVKAADFAPLWSMRWIGLLDGPAAGEVRRLQADRIRVLTNSNGYITHFSVDVDGPMPSRLPVAGNHLTFLGNGITGIAEEFFRQTGAGPASTLGHRLPGNDVLASMASVTAAFPFEALAAAQLGRLLAHEIGHTLGLAHGGNEASCAYRGDVHWSLMSYTHQSRVEPWAPLKLGGDACPDPRKEIPPFPGLAPEAILPGVVDSYSKGADPLGFNEWGYVRLEAWATPWFLGNSQMREASVLPPVHPPGEPSPVETAADSLDVQPPRLIWLSPAGPIRVAPGSSLSVEFKATDNVGITALEARLDADGNETISGPAEIVVPTHLGNDRYRATFTVSGTEGTRMVLVEAADRIGNVARLTPRLLVGSASFPDTTPPFIEPVNPREGEALPSSGALAVRFRTSDFGPEGDELRAWIEFDRDGNGSINPDAEVFPAEPAEAAFPGTHAATLPEPTGIAGSRILRLVAEDAWLNRATRDLSVGVTPPDNNPPTLLIESGPAEGSIIGYGQVNLRFRLRSTDDSGIAELAWSLDANGDGILGGAGTAERQVFPVGGGTSVTRDLDFFPTFRGPGGNRTLLFEVVDTTGNRTVVTRTLQLADTTPPTLWVSLPGAFDPVRLGEPLNVSGLASDDQAISRLTVSLDVNGDGVVAPGEIVEASWPGVDRFEAVLPSITGAPGPRLLTVRAVDPIGQSNVRTFPIEVTPGLVVHTPLANDTWRVGSTHAVSLEATTPSFAPALPVFHARFDVDGDGIIAGPLEDQRIPAQSNQSGFIAARYARATLAFGSLSGPAGVRRLRVEIEGEPATLVERDVQVETPADSGRLSVRLSHIPSTSPLLQAIGDGHAIPTPVATVSNVVLFTALTPREGIELWRSDGTLAGTTLLRDINAGFSEGLNSRPEGSDPSGFVLYRGKVYFAATDQGGGFSTPTLGTGRELWVTDGSPLGTQLVRDINTNRIPVHSSDSSSPTELVVFQDRIWFNAADGRTGQELWTSDGTAAGTVQFMDILPGQFSSNPTRLTVAGNHLYFVIDQRALWRTDGTVAGTYRVYPVEEPDFSTPGWGRLVAVGNRLFALRILAGFHELWTSDGTPAGTRRVKVLAPFATQFGTPEIAVVGNQLVFSAETATEGRELWVTDGTDAGTRLLRDIWPGGPDAFGRIPNGQPRGFTQIGDRVVFTALAPDVGDEPWITDGTDAGTRSIGDVAPNAGEIPTAVPTGSSPSNYAGTPDSLWFAANDGNTRTGNELRRWNGIDAPYLVRDLSPLWVNRLIGQFGIFSGPAAANPTALLPLGNRVFFRATDPVYGDELHVSDGTAAGTRRLRNLNSGAPRPALLLRRDGSRLLASGYDGRLAVLREWTASDNVRTWAAPSGGAPELRLEHGNGWVFVLTNGQSGNLRRAILHDWRDTAPQPTPRLEALDMWRIASGAGFVWAAGVDTNNTPVLWRIGSTGDPVVFPIPGSEPSYTLFQWAALGDRLLFSASGERSRELWAGDASGVRPVRTSDGTLLNFVDRFHVFNSRLYFQAATNTATEYWSTDGTSAGTRRFREESPAAGRPVAELQPVTLNGKLLFSAVRFGVPHELWISDGTTVGTVALGRVVDPIRGEMYARAIRHLTVAGDRAFFNAATVYGEELWVTDGTPGGTRMVADIATRPVGTFIEPGSDPVWITALGRNVLFVAGNATEGRELWFSDGTEAGTRMVRSLVPGPSSPDISNLTALGGRIFFTAKTTAEGRELWATDGTAEGTAPVEDLLPGPMSSDPSNLTPFGGRLAYLARDDADDISLRSVGTTVSPYEAWLARFTLPPGFPRDPSADGDGDGFSNVLEFVYGTSPVDPGDRMGFTSVRSLPGVLPTLELTYLRPSDWRTRGMNFQLEFTQRFGGWSVLFPSRTTVENLGALERVTVEVQGELRMDEFFVRLRITGL